jgi:tight adherence protein B
MDMLILVVLFSAATVSALVYGVYQYMVRDKVIIAQRVDTYANLEEEAALAAEAELRKESPFGRFAHVLFGRGYIQRLEEQLAGADIPMRPSEFLLLRLVLAGVGFLIGISPLSGYLHSALILAILGFLVPGLYVRLQQQRRRAKFVRQLADALMLLTNSLRSGYSFLKGLELVAKEMDDPISKELNRMLREVNLGATVEDALLNLGRRLNSQDLDIVISAYLVQKDVGGNLNEIMEKVAETIRERLRIQGDIKVLTAQGRLSGLVVGLLPFFVFGILLIVAPGYFAVLLGEPYVGTIPSWMPLGGGQQIPLGVLLGLLAVTLQLIGVYAISKIVAIKV